MSDDRDDLDQIAQTPSVMGDRQAPLKREGPERDPRLADRARPRVASRRSLTSIGGRTVLLAGIAKSDVGVATLAIAVGIAPAIAGLSGIDSLIGSSEIRPAFVVGISALLVLSIATLRWFSRQKRLRNG